MSLSDAMREQRVKSECVRGRTCKLGMSVSSCHWGSWSVPVSNADEDFRIREIDRLKDFDNNLS